MLQYDLKDRTLLFSKKLLKEIRNIKDDDTIRIIKRQLIRSGTSIGANYMKANNAISKQDFFYKIIICKKESQETTYWLELLLDIFSNAALSELKDEAHELTLIFNKIASKRPKKVVN